MKFPFSFLRALVCWAFVSNAAAAPTVSVTSPLPGTTVSSLTSVTITFSEAVTGVGADDLTVNAEAAAALTGTGAGPYVFTFTQPPPGNVSVSWDFDHGIAGTAATGAFVPAGGWNYTLTDTIAPTHGKLRTSVAGQEMDALVPAAGSKVAALTQTEVTFSEDVTGVNAADLLIDATTATGVTGEGRGPYVFTFTQPASPGTINFQWAAAPDIFDSSGNAFAGGTWSVTLSPADPGILIITEFMAANASGILDENSETSDWIELQNNGATAVTLTGWSLTNDPGDPGKWVLPARTLNAGARFLVYASAKDRKPTVGNLHTSFSLNPNGDYLGLFRPESPRGPAASQYPPNYNPDPAAPVLEYPVQRYNYSYGILTDGSLRYFLPASPNAANAATGLTEVLSPPGASVSRGFFNESFPLILTHPDAAATIRYTLDGTDPLTTSPAYTGPLTISNTTVLRASAFATGKVPSASVTHSYLFLDQIVNQASPPYDNPANANDNTNPPLPRVSNVPGGPAFPVAWGTNATASYGFPSLVTNLTAGQIPADYGMDPEIVNDAARYNDNGVVDAAGKTNSERIRQALRELPLLSIVMKNDDMFGTGGIYVEPNVRSKGTTFEKPCSVELLMPDGTTGFVSTCGIRIHGNASREPWKNPKHGFKLNFKGTFGANELAYALFPDTPVKEFDDLILRADFNSGWCHWDGTQRSRGTRLRDAFSKDTFRDMGRAAGHHRYVHLFINGLYWGTYDPTEQENNGFAAASFGGTKDDYDVYDQGALKSGTATAYSAMLAIAAPIDNPKYEQMKQYLDVPWFIDYMLLHFYLGHQDWGDDVNKNWYAVRNNKNGGKFKYLPWDMENLMWGETVNRVGVASPASGLHPKLNGNAQYKLDFADRVHRHMVKPGGVLLPAANIARWNEWRAVMQNGIVCESARWGDYRRDVHPYSGGPYPLYKWNVDWMTEMNRLKNTYFPTRTTNVLAQLRSAGLYPTLNAPEFRNSADNVLTGDQIVAAGYQLKMQLVTPAPAGTTSAGTIYYTTDGNDPRVAYDTTGTRTATAQAYSTPLTLSGTTTVKARALNGAVWSALIEATFTTGSPAPQVVISEINYNPRGNQGGTSSEFIEIYNAGARDADLSAWSLEGVDFVFPYGLTLGAGDRLVLANNSAPAVFAAQYPGVVVAGYFGGSLDNSDERISLNDAAGRRVFSVEYSDHLPWPAATDNGGYSLELISAAGDPQSAANWKASNGLKGTPGAANSAQPSGVVISEFFAAGGAGYVSNPGITPIPDFVELYNPTLSSANLGDWSLQGAAFPAATTIAPGARLLIQAGPNATSSIRVTDSFNRMWGEITLRNASGVVVDGVRYGPQVDYRSFFRSGNSWTLGMPTPGAANVAAFIQSPLPLGINEFLADPVPGEDDWIEFYNHDSGPVVLTGYTIEVNGSLFRITVPAAISDDTWLRFYCDPGSTRGDNINLPLPGSGATLTVRNAAWEIMDTLTYGLQSAGISQGRLPDATGSLTTLTFPSPGLANTVPPAVRPLINEILVINRDGDNAPWARRPAWIELTNPTSAPVTVQGWDFRTKSRTPQSWTFPDGISIPPGGLLTVWCDPSQPASTAPSSHLNSALPLNDSYNHWGVELIAGDGQVYDQVTWGVQLSDRSIGRLPDNSWALLAAPTRGMPNAAGAALAPGTGVKINEWFPSVPLQPLIGDYIELYNPAAAPAALDGLWLTDEPSEVGRRKWQVPALSFIAGQKHALFNAGDGTSQPNVFLFNLSADGEYVRLSQNDAATTAVDAFSYGLPAATGQSQGRVTDGSATTGSMQLTPGAPNSTAPGPAITGQPVSNAVPAGQNTSFSAQVSGAVTLEWRRNGQPIPASNGLSLILPLVTAADEGDYTIAATNAAGTTVSQPAHLTVLYTWAAYAAQYGLSTQNADADSDGLTNGEEFLAGSNPLVADNLSSGVAGGFEAIAGTNYLTLEYTVSRRAAFSSLSGQRSSDLSLWNDAAPAFTEPVSTQPNGDYRVKVKFPWLPGEDRGFVRLRLVP